MPRAKMTVTADTPTNDVRKSRKYSVALLQLLTTAGREDSSDYLRAMTQFRTIPIVCDLIDAKRSELFDYGQLLLRSPNGAVWPSAKSIEAVLEEIKDGKFDVDSPGWVSVVESLSLGDGFTRADGKKLKSEEELFSLVTFGEAPVKRTKSKSKPKTEAPPTTENVVQLRAEPPVEPEEKPETSNVVPSVDFSDLVEFIGKGLETLDGRILDRLDGTDKAHSEAVEEIHGRLDMIFGSLQVIATAVRSIYERQSEIDIFIDPNGEFPELDAEAEEELDALINYGREDVDESGEDAPVVEDEGESPQDDAPPEEEKVEEKKVETKASNDVLNIDSEFVASALKMDLDGFKNVIKAHKTISVPDFPEGKELLKQLSVEKLRILAASLGIAGAENTTYRMVLIHKIENALTSE